MRRLLLGCLVAVLFGVTGVSGAEQLIITTDHPVHHRVVRRTHRRQVYSSHRRSVRRHRVRRHEHGLTIRIVK